MPAPTFGRVPDHLRGGLGNPKKERQACYHLTNLNYHIGNAHNNYATGSWGYTVLRTVYTPESDALFPAAIERLKRYVHYWCHALRYPSYGERGESKVIHSTERNDELYRRFYLDIIEDKAALANLDRDGLVEYFRRWVASLGLDPYYSGLPRFLCYLVIDAESLASLAQIPDDPPPLRVAKDLEEKRAFLSAGSGAWVWLMDTRPFPAQEDPSEYAYEDWHQDSYCGWLRMSLRDIQISWFDRLIRGGPGKFSFFRQEEPEGSGIFYYTEMFVAPSRSQQQPPPTAGDRSCSHRCPNFLLDSDQYKHS